MCVRLSGVGLGEGGRLEGPEKKVCMCVQSMRVARFHLWRRDGVRGAFVVYACVWLSLFECARRVCVCGCEWVDGFLDRIGFRSQTGGEGFT